MNKEAIDLIIAKNPKLAASRQKLESMQQGAYCLHRSWGFGLITGYDEIANRLIIDFEGGKNAHPMDPVFCIDKLEVLSPDNILVRAHTTPAAIAELIEKKPVELVIEVLSHCKDSSASSIELENLLEKVIGENKFKKWWSATKKLLSKDPRIACPSKKTEPYFLREVPMLPEQEILEEFYLNKHPLKKIHLAEKLYQLASSISEIANDLPQILEELTVAIREAHQLKQAERLYGCWVRNDLARHLHIDVETLNPTSRSLILETEDLSALAEELPPAYHKRFLDLLSRVYTEDWQRVCINLLKNSSGKLTNECVNFLMERGCGELVADCFKRWLNEQTMRSPVLFWIVKNRNVRRYNPLVQSLLTPRLLKSIFSAIDAEALAATSNRRIQLAELISEDQELIPDLLSESNTETAKDLAQTLILNQGFENLTKRSLLARFIRQFPSIQSLVAGDAEQQSEQLIVSQSSFDSRKKEYESLINEKIPENKQAISIAREHGDLRENSEYKMARQDQETLLARKAQLENELNRARVTDFKETSCDVIGIGSYVELIEGSSGKNHQFAILGAWDSDPANNIVSYKTPLAQSLLSKKIGDQVKIKIGKNEEIWTIKSIVRWFDQKALKK